MGNNGSFASVPKAGNNTRTYKRESSMFEHDRADDLLNQFEEKITFWKTEIVKARGNIDSNSAEEIKWYFYTQMKVAAEVLLKQIPQDFLQRYETSEQAKDQKKNSCHSTEYYRQPTLKSKTSTEAACVRIAQKTVIDNNASTVSMTIEKESTEPYTKIHQQMCDFRERLELEKDDTIRLLAANDQLKTELKQFKAENEELLTRLSKIAGDRLTKDNPNITDLNDSDRPLKLGEKYSELYDNEWTNAFECLTEVGYTEEESIETLHLTLLNAFEFCEKKASQILKQTDDAVNLLFDEYRKSAVFKDIPVHLTISRKQLAKFAKYCKEQSTIEDMQLQKRWEPKRRKSYADETEQKNEIEVASRHVKVEEQMTKVRKEVSRSILPIVQRAYMEASWRKHCLHDLKPFVMQCLYIGWMMVVQSPPMSFKTALRGDKFDSNVFKQYTCTGSIVDFVVWPALLLHECGPVVGKGVAQPRKPN
ncbi:hypothetical protein MAR_022675 [Mya arenaria]|uniref:Mitochondria-eating protein C-terminal domain-containing protein n=1 Tax=Mya arenaria TaxID=6604 RepID=A0ABY7DKU2_MYAAR|nr:uncharacterized protein LOC128228448 [Mya arenaria]WAQ98302.1 hypothetical protein MAR_022675 [Mya arenaria]